jgi:hypothetical protein
MNRTGDLLLRLQGKVLVDETEMVLKATAASEDFRRTMDRIAVDAGATPGQLRALERQALELPARHLPHR